MLQITVTGREIWDEAAGEFKYPNTTVLNLEHSLVSISKWESKWHKSFFSRERHTDEETIDYIRCMTINHNVDNDIYMALSSENINTVVAYIDDQMSAMPRRKNTGGVHEQITSEKIYSWMFTYRIPIECEKWHITRLLNVIAILDDANTPPKKRSQRAITNQYAKLNAERRAAMHTKG